MNINKEYTYEEWCTLSGIVFGGFYHALEPKIKYCDSTYKKWVKSDRETRKLIAEFYPPMIAVLPTPTLIKTE